MTHSEALRDMRRYAEDDNYGPDVGAWIIAIEAAMREPKAYISHTSQGDVLDWEPQFDAPSRTKLFTFPPDAAGEIERLRREIESANADGEAYAEIAGQEQDEIERLRELLTAYTERYRCRCRHHWCKRCELDRKAAQLLPATEGK